MMSNLSLEGLEWGEFIIEEVFDEVDSSPYSLDYSHIDKKYKEVDEIAYVTRSALNNGIAYLIGDMSEDGKPPVPGNWLTVGLDTATVKYQSTPFYTGQNIHIVRDKNINRYTALFIIPLIEKSLAKFGWGGYSATLGRFRQTRFLLPVKDNEPDWTFMENYMRQIETETTPKIIFENHKITDHRELNEVEWGQFMIDDLFTISSGVRLTKKNMKAGNTPFIGATEYNNGVTNFVWTSHD
jgi:Type I restriction modification DNA specificity domain